MGEGMCHMTGAGFMIAARESGIRSAAILQTPLLGTDSTCKLSYC